LGLRLLLILVAVTLLNSYGLYIVADQLDRAFAQLVMVGKSDQHLSRAIDSCTMRHINEAITLRRADPFSTDGSQ